MPGPSDFLIGFEAGNQFVEGVRESTRRDEGLKLSREELELRKKQLEVETARQRASADYMKLQADYMKEGLAQRVEDRKMALEGMKRAGEFQKEINSLIVENPTGEDFVRKSLEISSKYADIFAHPDPAVRDRANSDRERALGFFKSSAGIKGLRNQVAEAFPTAAPVGQGREVQDLVDAGYLSGKQVYDKNAIKMARERADTDEMDAYAAEHGVDLGSVMGSGGHIETGPAGGWSPAYKAMIKRSIDKKSASINPPRDKGKLRIGLGAQLDEEGQPIKGSESYFESNIGPGEGGQVMTQAQELLSKMRPPAKIPAEAVPVIYDGKQYFMKPEDIQRNRAMGFKIEELKGR